MLFQIKKVLGSIIFQLKITPERNKYQKYFADLSRVCEVKEAIEE
jgi:hypothetical protein